LKSHWLIFGGVKIGKKMERRKTTSLKEERHSGLSARVKDGSGKPTARRNDEARTCSGQPDPCGHAQKEKEHVLKNEIKKSR
jgi:hypothetical protein